MEDTTFILNDQEYKLDSLSIDSQMLYQQIMFAHTIGVLMSEAHQSLSNRLASQIQTDNTDEVSEDIIPSNLFDDNTTEGGS